MTEEDLKRLKQLARECQGLVGRYTRMPGPNGNGDRVANLLTEDTYKIGTEMMEILNK